jgi:hypothetical protein
MRAQDDTDETTVPDAGAGRFSVFQNHGWSCR